MDALDFKSFFVNYEEVPFDQELADRNLEENADALESDHDIDFDPIGESSDEPIPTNESEVIDDE